MRSLAEFQHLHHPAVDDALSVAAHVVRTGEPVLRSSITEADANRIENVRVRVLLQILEPRNVAAVPLANQARRYGALVAAISGSSRSFIQDDLEFLMDVATRVGPSLRAYP